MIICWQYTNSIRKHSILKLSIIIYIHFSGNRSQDQTNLIGFARNPAIHHVVLVFPPLCDTLVT